MPKLICCPDANQFKDVFIKAQKDNEEVGGKSEDAPAVEKETKEEEEKKE
jgi:hypothetical protein